MKNNDQGWICLHRKIMQSMIWPRNEFTPFEFWVYLLIRTSYTDHQILNSGQLWQIKRGQVLTSWERLCADSGRSRGWLKRRISEFVKLGMIKHENQSNHFSLITICNFDKYNNLPAEDDTTLGQTVEQTVGQHSTKVNKDKTNNIYSDFASQIEEIIEYYQKTIKPLKKISQKRIGMLSDRLRTFSVDDCKKAIDNVNASPFHSGQNEEGKIYKDFDMIFKTDEQLEKYLNLKSGKEFEKKPKLNRYLRALDEQNRKESRKSQTNPVSPLSATIIN